MDQIAASAVKALHTVYVPKVKLQHNLELPSPFLRASRRNSERILSGVGKEAAEFEIDCNIVRRSSENIRRSVVYERDHQGKMQR